MTFNRDVQVICGKTREEVHDRWIRLQAQARAGPVATKIPTVEAFMTYWLREIIEPNSAPLTYATYETLTRLYIVPGLGRERVDNRLTVQDVQVWLNKVAKTCTCCAQGKDARGPVGKRKCCAVGACCEDLPVPRTVKGIRAVLRSALSQSQVEELVSRNVAALVKLPAIHRRKGGAWTTDEARTLLESAWTSGDYLYAAYVLVLVLGLRKGEVLGLTWDHVDWAGWDKPCDEHGCEFCPHAQCRDQHEIGLRVDKQLQRVRGRLLHRETKTEESDAPLPLPAICAVALRERQVRQRDAAATAGDNWHATNMVFTTRYGRPIEPRNFNRSYDARIMAAAARRITVHDARRTCASLLVDLDVHPRVAMAILRHADFSITMEVHSQASPKATRDALRRLSESLGQ